MIQPDIDSNNNPTFQDARDAGTWKAGLVLHIGRIINHKGECVDSMVLEPQGIAHLVSRESVHLPDDVCGLAHVLTRLCNDGLLTLNIGVIDPGWRNHLSTPVLNFSSEKRLLQVGQPFLRMSFHRIENFRDIKGSVLDNRHKNVDRDSYIRDLRYRAVGSFGKNFLNIKQLVGRASKKETARFKGAMLKYLPIGAFSLAFFALMVTVGVAALARFSASQAADEMVVDLMERVDRLESGRSVSSYETRGDYDAPTSPEAAREEADE